MKRLTMTFVLSALLGCSSSGGVTNGAGGSGGAASAGGSAGTTSAGGSVGSVGGGGADASGPVNAVPLPPGSRVFNDVVNLVSGVAAQELDNFIVNDPGPRPIFDQHDLTTNLNLFLEHYEELYDFVYFFTGHPLPQTNTIGKFEAVTRAAQVGTGNNIQIVADGYKTNGRVKGVIGIQYIAYGPFAHELLHYWANFLDPMFGFGASAGDPHWGFAGIHGQLGGFDAPTLACETPPGSVPPGCLPMANGRLHYLVDQFGTLANGPNIPFAPFELYLMGLLPRAQAPAEITLLTDANKLEATFDPSTGKVIVDAGGTRVVRTSDIVARHGETKALGSDERAFRAAFVVISAEPVSDALLAEVASWSAIFGNRQSDPVFKSFESLTGNRATLDTRLGPRRDMSAPPPEIRPPFGCDVLAQDCEPAGAGCYLSSPRTLCAIPRGVMRDMPCADTLDCAAGMECVNGPSSRLCEPFCDPMNSASPLWCNTLCPNHILLGIPDAGLIIGRCLPP